MRYARQRDGCDHSDAVEVAATIKTHQWGTQPEMFGPRHLYRLGLMLAALRPLPRGSRVLDAACGLGQLTSRLHDAGYRAFGIDGELTAALYTRRSSNTPAVVGDIARLPFRSEVFDAITSGETLEHLDDDAAAVSEFARIVRRGGRIVATVPAMRSLWSASDDYYEHRRRYSRDELVALVGGAGFEIEGVSFWGFPVVLLYDTLVLLPLNRRRARGGGVESIARAGRSSLLVRFVRALFALDRLFGWIPFGPGLLLAATKRA